MGATVIGLMLIQLAWAFQTESPQAPGPSTEKAEQAMRRACDFFRDEVASHGGYLWKYSADLSKREGEGRAGQDTVWVQPPGTPSIGLAFLQAYEATDDTYYLDAAVEVAECLLRGQLRSGGWDYRIEFADKPRRKYAYRVDPSRPRARNATTLDDNTTQHTLRFLIRLDRTLSGEHESIAEAIQYALKALLAAQYPNGAWPQRFSQPTDAERFPIRKAAYPDSWSRNFAPSSYGELYTLNDNVMSDMIDVMLLAARTYEEAKYEKACAQAADFLLLAQMPDPQPAWAQQYDVEMQPAWARKFEPPAITGGESQSAMRALLKVYQVTGETRYLDSVRRAIEYLKASQLDNGQLARFYELQTNRPLYFTRQYELTYDDDDLPTHYSFKVGHDLDGMQAEVDRLSKMSPAQLRHATGQSTTPEMSSALERQAEKVIGALDNQGRWLDDAPLRYHGPNDPTRQVIDCRTFVRNMQILVPVH